MSRKICKIVIIEPSIIIQRGLIELLKQLNDVKIVGVQSDLDRIEERISVTAPDLVIINPSVISLHRRGAMRTLFPEQAVVALLYNYMDKELLKQFNGVIDIYDDSHKIEIVIGDALAQLSETELVSDGSELSEREKEILIAVSKGMLNKEIATLHNISIHTVISHRKNISRKTGIKSVAGFVVYSLLNNLITQDEIQ